MADRAAAKGALTTVGAVAALGLFLPSIDAAWDSAPSAEQIYRCRTGEVVYLGASAAITLLASYANDSALPFVVGFGLALLIVGMQEHALRHRSTDAG